MEKVYVTLFGAPTVTVDGQPVAFAYRKAAALFYYMVLQRTSSREYVASLLWGDSITSSAMKNLRHAIYTIQKNIGFSIFTSDRSGILSISDGICLECDVLEFYERDRLPDTYQELMEGFHVPQCAPFETWLDGERIVLRTQYLEKLLNMLNQAVERENTEEVEELGIQYINQDPLEESVAVILMKFYLEQKQYRKAIGIYQNLCKHLSADLSLSPLKETSKLYYQIINEWNASTMAEEENLSKLLLGKDAALHKLLSLCKYTQKQKVRTPCALIEGDAGVGKTYLLDCMLDNHDFSDYLICRSFCYQSEANTPLAPWNNVMTTLIAELEERKFVIPENLGKAAATLLPCLSAVYGQKYSGADFDYPLQQNYHMALESTLLIFSAVAREFPILFIFEDIHWMDQSSSELLNIVLHRMRNLDITVVCTSRLSQPDHIKAFIQNGCRDNIMISHTIGNFTKDETRIFINHNLNYTASEELLSQIYAQTGGNALLLVQLLNVLRERPDASSLSKDLGDIIGFRLDSLSLSERQILDLISIFPDWAPFDALSSILTMDTVRLMYLCNRLEHRMLLLENYDGTSLSYSLSHELIRATIIKQQSSFVRKTLHSHVAQYLESNMETGSFIQYDRLIYHFSESGDAIKEFQYRVLSLDSYTGMRYAVLPMLTSDSYSSSSLQNMSDYFDMLEEKLLKLKSDNPSHFELFRRLERTLLLAKSRYAVYVGRYITGMDALNRLSGLCEDAETSDYLIHAQIQYIYYGVQTSNTQIMSDHLEIMRKLLSNHTCSAEYGTYLRMKGLLELMRGEYAEARLTLQQSIYTFSCISQVDDDRYSINVAGAYNYIAETYRMEENYDQAFLFYDQAILYNRSRGYYPGAAVFYTNYGLAAFQKGEYEVSRRLFSFALEIYRTSHEYSRRPIALSYLAYFAYQDGKYALAADYIDEALQISETIGAPTWKAAILSICWKIHLDADKNGKAIKPLDKFWPENLQVHRTQYRSQLQALYDAVPFSYELNAALADLQQPVT